MRDYIAKDPRTGKPLRAGSLRKKKIDLAYRPIEGPWDALQLDRILPLATGSVQVETVIWKDRERILRRSDAIRALPRIRGKDIVAAHHALDLALGDIDPRLRISGLASLPYCALQQSSNFFEHLHELLEDVDPDVMKAAQDCLVIVAPVFPSATEETLRRELRESNHIRRGNAFKALKEVADSWPEVAEIHIDELIREEEDDLRTRAAALLSRLTKHKSATLWDLIGWTLQDKTPSVRRNSARALVPLCDHAPKIAQIALEIALFDEDDQVRSSALKALRKLDPHSYKMKRLLMNGIRHDDRNIRLTCIKMLPVIMVESEARTIATELIENEKDSEIRTLLDELMIDQSLEGTEDQKNAFLAPAEKVEFDEGSLSTPPPSAIESAQKLQVEKKQDQPNSPKQDTIRRPTQDEIYYGDDFDDEF
ncbi:MAG: HEAT repeat domain-containing protein [Candidatus Thermoplasmatota archaeon]|nr:HEAT repeat domain-containing protein [Candidatus Thermoplasmatota archaeon]